MNFLSHACKSFKPAWQSQQNRPLFALKSKSPQARIQNPPVSPFKKGGLLAATLIILILFSKKIK